MKDSQGTDKGTIVAVSTSLKKGEKKSNMDTAELIADYGLKGDAHAGNWHRQVSLLALESIEKIRAKGLDVAPGDFAENITTRGLNLWELEVGTMIGLGEDAMVEITQIGKECHNRCAIYHRVGDCVMPKEGIFARVIKGGSVCPGDRARVTE